jgi:hypothetical protein
MPMNGYLFENIQPASKELLEKGTFIVLMHPDKTPPHIALLCDGRFFSHGVTGTKLGESVELFWKYITQKQTPVLFVKTSLIGNTEAVKNCFQQFTFEGEKEETCLSPIKLYLSENHKINTNQIKLIFNLLDALKEQTEGVYSKHLPLENGAYSLKTYTLESVLKRIEQLATT